MTRLTDEQRQAVDSHHGYLEVEGGGSRYVVMSIQAYREMMGVGSEAEYQASLAAIREGVEDIDAGRTRPVDDFLHDLDRRHGLSS